MAINLLAFLDRFIGLMGAVFCAPLALMIPTICHLKIVARTNNDYFEDISIIVFSMIITVFCVVQNITADSETEIETKTE